MPSNVHSFCIRESNVESENRVARLRKYADKVGTNFSLIVLEALRLYETELELQWEPGNRPKTTDTKRNKTKL